MYNSVSPGWGRQCSVGFREEKTQKLGGRVVIGACVREDLPEAVACSRVC